MRTFGSFNLAEKIVITILVGIGFCALVVGTLALSGLIIWALWNALVPALAGGPHITYFQGVLISVALSIVSAVFKRR